MRFRWNRNTDTPLPPEVPAGQNPPDGAIIDYLLADVSQGEVKLEIFDAQSHLVRRYSSNDQPKSIEKIAAENPIPMYWVRLQQILSSEAGFHRFVWDLHPTHRPIRSTMNFLSPRSIATRQKCPWVS